MILVCKGTCGPLLTLSKGRDQFPVIHPCAGVPDWQFRRIEQKAHIIPYLICSPSSCTYHSHIIQNKSFLEYFMRILNSCAA